MKTLQRRSVRHSTLLKSSELLAYAQQACPEAGIVRIGQLGDNHIVYYDAAGFRVAGVCLSFGPRHIAFISFVREKRRNADFTWLGNGQASRGARQIAYYGEYDAKEFGELPV